MIQPHYDQAVAHGLTLLRTQLPDRYVYHSIFHTAEDVLPAAMRLAEAAGLPQAETDLLRVAAAFHDVGFIRRVDGHELAGMRVAAQTLPGFGFSDDQIEAILGMILATRLPQSPRTLAEEILADADLDVLGREDFMARSLDLLHEMANRGIFRGREEWLHEQIAFLTDHTYFTQAARSLRDAGKRQNIAQLRATLTRLESETA